MVIGNGFWKITKTQPRFLHAVVFFPKLTVCNKQNVQPNHLYRITKAV